MSNGTNESKKDKTYNTVQTAEKMDTFVNRTDQVNPPTSKADHKKK